MRRVSRSFGRYRRKTVSDRFFRQVASDLGPPRSNRPHPCLSAMLGRTVLCDASCRRGWGIPQRGGFPAGRSWVSLSRALFLGSDVLPASHPAAGITTVSRRRGRSVRRLRRLPSPPPGSALPGIPSSTAADVRVTRRYRPVSRGRRPQATLSGSRPRRRRRVAGSSPTRPVTVCEHNHASRGTPHLTVRSQRRSRRRRPGPDILGVSDLSAGPRPHGRSTVGFPHASPDVTCGDSNRACRLGVLSPCPRWPRHWPPVPAVPAFFSAAFATGDCFAREFAAVGFGSPLPLAFSDFAGHFRARRRICLYRVAPQTPNFLRQFSFALGQVIHHRA